MLTLMLNPMKQWLRLNLSDLVLLVIYTTAIIVISELVDQLTAYLQH